MVGSVDVTGIFRSVRVVVPSMDNGLFVVGCVVVSAVVVTGRVVVTGCVVVSTVVVTGCVVVSVIVVTGCATGVVIGISSFNHGELEVVSVVPATVLLHIKML